jgi:hypothetical protein
MYFTCNINIFMVYFDVFIIYFNVFHIYIYILLIDILIVNLNTSKCIYYVFECIHSVVKPKYFYKPLLLILWINPELPSLAMGF